MKDSKTAAPAILVVEDEFITAIDLKKDLEEMGFIVPGTVDNGEDAVIKASELHPDLVLMDITLRGPMTGIQSAGYIRNLGIPVVFLTAHADESTVGDARVTEPFGYILKPYENRNLRISIGMALYKHALESKIRESESKYRGFVENFIGVAFRLTRDFSPVFLHGAVETITGYTEADFLAGRPPWYGNLHPEDAPVIREQNMHIRDQPDYSGSRDYRIIRKNGEFRWVRELIRSVADSSGTHTIIQGALYDITDQKKTELLQKQLNEELELRVKERTASLQMQILFLQQLIDAIPLPIYYKDTTPVYKGCNNAFESWIGLPRRNIVGNTAKDILPAELDESSYEKDLMLLKNRGIQVYQRKFRHADGSDRDVIFRRATFTDPNGSVAGIIGVLMDITDRAKAEAALRESEVQLRVVVQDQAELVYRYSPDRTVLFANDAFLKYFNTAGQNTIGYIFREKIHPDDERSVREQFHALAPDKPIVQIEHRIIKPNGIVRWLRWNHRAFFDNNNRLTGFLSVGRDITDIKGGFIESSHAQDLPPGVPAGES